jgi:hypothetical protein
MEMTQQAVPNFANSANSAHSAGFLSDLCDLRFYDCRLINTLKC